MDEDEDQDPEGGRDDELFMALLRYAMAEGMERAEAHPIALRAAQAFMDAVLKRGQERDEPYSTDRERCPPNDYDRGWRDGHQHARQERTDG